jgi:hypothetical protein
MSRHLLEQCKDYLEHLRRDCNVTFGKDIQELLDNLQRELDVGRKYKTGNYLILRFDEYGAKIATVLADESGLIRSQNQAKKEIAEGICASAVVTQVLWNSKDRQAERWEAK